MQRISSRDTIFFKKIFPVIWFGFLTVLLAIGLDHLIAKGKVEISFLLIPIGMAVFGYFLMKKLVFDIVDEVWEEGDTLIVRNKGEEIYIALSEIINVSYSGFTNPPRATLILRHPGPWGKEITFLPPRGSCPGLKSPIIDALIERIDIQRSKKGTR
ncbi:MAG: hypothetical protein NTZ78_11220 [Candidatus Aureabacteria bacterium]|nr:hypothetical protein [Candidatus Auribacterota bacterium]